MEVSYPAAGSNTVTGIEEMREFAPPQVTQYGMDEPGGAVQMDSFDDATTESTPLYPVTNIAPRTYINYRA